MTRDLTEAQFRKRLADEGFGPSDFLSGYYCDTTGVTGTGFHIGGIYSMNPWRFDRRATLAHLIRERTRHAAKATPEAPHP